MTPVTAAGRLQWWPNLGMGFLPVTEQPYDDAYFQKYEQYARSELGRDITCTRMDFVTRNAGGLASLVDVGIGCGAFLDAAAPYFRDLGGYDINPAGVAWLDRREMFVDPYEAQADILTFWDAIEHIPDAGRMLANARRWVFASLPIVPGDGPPAPDWKHFRPDEHCWYWTRDGFVGWMRAHGFELVECTDVETRLGREDILTFAFRRCA